MKKFWKKTEGFTLVELIVVIAILGILAGVGTVGYSGYIKKANMAADQQLASEVANAMQLGYYSNIGNAKAGYVILKTDAAPSLAGKTISSAEIEADIKKAFGDDLSGLLLEYDGWTVNSDLLKTALELTDPAAIGSSTYLTKSNVPELLGNVQTVTAAAAGLLGTVAKTPSDYINSLKGALGSDYMDKAVSAGILNKSESGDYTFVDAPESGNMNVSGDLQAQLSNLMVFSVANELNAASSEDITSLMMGSNPNQKYSTATVMAAQYALYKAVALESGLNEDFNTMNTALSSAHNLADAQNALEGFNSKYKNTKIKEYCLGEGGPSADFMNDASAISSIMKGVSSVYDDYKEGDALKDSTLYTSGDVSNDLNTYLSAAELAASVEDIDTLKAALNVTDGVIVIISGKGETSVCPGLN